MKTIAIYLVLLIFTTANTYTRTKTVNISSLTKKQKKEWIKRNHRTGMYMYSKKRYAKALLLFKSILKIDENNQDALYNCACMNALLKKTDNALFFLSKLYHINPRWRIKLLPNKEKDFRYIKRHARFILYKRFFLQKISGLRYLRYIKGYYKGKRTGKDFEGGATVTTHNISIQKQKRHYYLTIVLRPAYGQHLRSKIIEIARYRNIYLLKLDDKATPHQFGFVEIRFYRRSRKALITFPFYNRNVKAPWDILKKIKVFPVLKDIAKDSFTHIKSR